MLDKGYIPHEVEKKWYEFWEKERLFAAEEQSTRKSYSIVIPPPNVTGILHMGHALNNTLQDILCRYRRLRGDNVLWMPGTDHAGIATQNVVEKKLAEKGITRHQLGRERFIEEVWKWKEQSGSAIINQLKRLGASCDWERERFTMDEGLSEAVRKVFVQLYHEGLIYRGNYIINWCHRCHTALADLEVEHEEHQGSLYYIKYPYVNSNDGLIVATTRPETMLGDTAVAINPDDDRYRNMPADHVILPLMNRKIPVIQDRYVDMSFGTGALKVTPAHDPNDYEIGQRHHLPSVKVIGDDGNMTEEAGKYEGLDRFVCREAVVKDLKGLGLLIKVEPHAHNIGHCYRCHTIIEPNLSRQWFVKTKPLAEKAIEAVKQKKTVIIPDVWENTYFEWMNNIRDWCISRQIWWGHQIPAWTCESCEQLTVEMTPPGTCPSCGHPNLIQESDVLDTWFSSALWPFSTMGWPNQTQLLKTFYPTSVLVTGFDILFFWVARMMMMGIHFMGDVPFRDVYVHALVRDEEGRKMSKSKGNVIDPISIIDNYGTDAFRFTLAAFAAQGRDIKMSEKRVEGYRHFINKLWNAARFILMNISAYPPSYFQFNMAELISSDPSLPNQWILSRLRNVTESVEQTLDTYKFNEGAAILYKFVWHELCDWYLEAIKPALYGKEGDFKKECCVKIVWRVFRDTLILLHPFIPFVTEELWHKLPATSGSIMRATFPTDDPQFAAIVRNLDAERDMDILINVITGIRNIRGEMNIAPSMELKVIIQTNDSHIRKTIDDYQDLISLLSRLKSLSVESVGLKPKASATAVIEGASIFVSLEGIIDLEKESQRLEKEIHKLTNELATLSKKLNNEDFLAKAPSDVVEKTKDRHRVTLEKQQKLQTNLDRIREVEIN